MHADAPVPAHDPEGQVDNMGPIGAAVGGVLAVAVLLGTLLLVRVLDVDWAPVLVIQGFVTAAYLALSAAIRLDLFAAALASTGGPPGTRRLKRRIRRRMRRGRPA